MTDDIKRTREVQHQNRAPEEVVINIAGEFSADYPDAEITGMVIREKRTDDGQLLWSVRIDGEA